MLKINKIITKILPFFNEEERIAFLKAMYDMCMADNRYDVLESIGFENIQDTILIELNNEELLEKFKYTDPIKIFKDCEKQNLVIETMIDTAVIDNHADIKEAKLIISYAKKWGIPFEKLKKSIDYNNSEIFELGLTQTLKDFIDLVKSHYH